MKVSILGATGMLGSEVKRYFASQGHELICPVTRFPDEKLFDELRGAEVIINCAGVKSDANLDNLYAANMHLPQSLALSLSSRQHLIHASTDGVFSGKCGPYSIATTPDPDDYYGWSKWLGEPKYSRGRVSVIRSSIIGLEVNRNQPRSLLGWLMSKQHQVAGGYTDHLWNGVTTLTWAGVAHKLMLAEHSGLEHLTCVEAVSKFELLKLMSQKFGIEVDIVPCTPNKGRDRRLVPTIVTQSIEEQLEALAHSRHTEVPVTYDGGNIHQMILE